jgi:acyl-CoA synthetase (AMP-forming)/AMP-acid ligase II
LANIAFLLDVAADTMGDRIAVGSRAGGLTFAEVRRRARVLGRQVAARPVDALSFADANGPAVPVALFAAAWAGVPYAPVNYRLPDDQRRRLLDRLGTTHHVGTGEGDAWVAGAGDGGDDGDYPAEPGRPAVLLFTSGTTAAPKSAVLDHDNLLAYVLNATELASAGDDEAVLLVVPPFHIAGVAGVLSSVFAGRRIVPLERFTPEAWVEAARAEQITQAFLVPTMLARIVALLDDRGGAELPSLRTLAYGGARMPVPVLERALELFPNAGFVNAYGLTETSATVTVLGPAEHRAAIASADPVVRARLGSAGRPVPGVEVEVIDDRGVPVPPGIEGTIRIRGDQVSGRYVEQGSVVDDLAERGRGLPAPPPGGAGGGGRRRARRRVGRAGGRHGHRARGRDGRRAGGLGARAAGRPEGAQAAGHGMADELPMTPTGKVLRRVVRAELAKQPGDAGVAAT